MKTTTWTLLMAVAVAMVAFTGAPPAAAQVDDETVAVETESSALSEAKEAVDDMLPEWFSFGLDQRNRVTHALNMKTLGGPNATNNEDGTEEDLFGRFRTRLWGRATPMENVEIGARLVWEWFIVCKPNEAKNAPSSDVIFDELFVKLTDLFDMPVEVTAGRQTILLGDGWLVFEGTPLDGSRTIFFDAIRTTLAMPDENMSLDAIFIANQADSAAYIKPFNNTNDKVGGRCVSDLAEYDEMAGILWLTNTAMEDLTWNGYLIYTHREATTATDPTGAAIYDNASDNLADLFTAGGRVAGNWGEQIKYRAEAACQFGTKQSEINGMEQTVDVREAFGINSRVTYLVMDAMDTALHAGYEFRSGDNNPDESFDILWGRYPQFSEMLTAYTDGLEGNPGALSNFHRFNVGAAAEPVEDLLVELNYHFLLADENNQPVADGFSANGDVRGHLFTGKAKFTHNEHAISTVTAEAFLPGNYYTDDRNDTATAARYELMLVW